MIANYGFTPSTITVATGTAVTWKNSDSDDHTITSTNGGPLGSPSFNRGGSYGHTFTTAGSYSYHCAIHPNMTGTVVVQ